VLINLFKSLLVMFFYIGLFMLPLTAYSFYIGSTLSWDFALLNALLAMPGLLVVVEKALAYLRRFLPLPKVSFTIQLREPKEAFTTFGETMVLIAVAWVLLALLFSYIYIRSGYSMLDALFESVSGVTTSGLSVVDVDALPADVILFRSFTGWVGGLGILGFAISALRGVTGRKIAELFGIREGDFLGSIRQIFFAYLSLTVVAFAGLYAVGFSPFHALNLALAGVSNNGFFPFSSYPFTEVQEYALGGVMLLGSFSILVYVKLFRGRIRELLREDLIFYLSLIVFFTLSLSYVSHIALREALLVLLSTITGGGFGYYDISLLGEGGLFIISGAMLIGAMLLSTGGGMKATRLLLILKAIKVAVERAFSPVKVVKKVRLNGQPIPEEELMQAFSIAFLFLLTFGGAALLFLESGHSLGDSLILSSTALGNVGVSTLDIASLPEPEKGLLILLMYIGRLEIMPAVALLLGLKEIFRWRH